MCFPHGFLLDMLLPAERIPQLDPDSASKIRRRPVFPDRPESHSFGGLDKYADVVYGKSNHLKNTTGKDDGMRRNLTAGILLSIMLMGGAARAMDIRLPFRPREIAAKAQKKGLPEGVSITSELDALKISAPSGIKLSETLTWEHVIDGAPPHSPGRDVELRLKLSGQGLTFEGGRDAGLFVIIAGKALSLPRGNFSDKTVSVKVKYPLSGVLPIVIGVRNFSGTLWVKEPVARISSSSTLPKKLPRKWWKWWK